MRLETLNALDSHGIINALNANSSKSNAATALERLRLPTKKSEKYRYFDIEKLMQKDWKIAQVAPNSFEGSGNRIIIEDGAVMNGGLIDGVSVEYKNFSDIDSEHFDALYYLNHLLSQDTIVIRISKDTKFEIRQILSKEDALINYRIVLLVDSNVHASVYETFEGHAKDAFVLGGYDIFISRDASLEFIKNQTLQDGGYTPIFSNRYKIDSNANLILSTFDFAKSDGLNIFRAQLLKNANFDASHLLYLNSNVKNGTVSEIVHEGQSSHSEQTNKAILDNSARGIFDALIRVQKSGKWTKAHQNSKAVLLHSGAYMASKPQLEIYIDDLEASHGSTTGQLDEKQLFYLQSRGISYSSAKKMLILAFANEIIDKIKDESTQNAIHCSFEEAYYGKSELDCLQTCHGCEGLIVGAENENN